MGVVLVNASNLIGQIQTACGNWEARTPVRTVHSTASNAQLTEEAAASCRDTATTGASQEEDKAPSQGVIELA